MKSKVLLSACVISLLMVGIGYAEIASISPVTLTDGNSSAVFNLGAVENCLESWTVDGVNQLNGQSLWYRIGNGSVTCVNDLEGWVISQDVDNMVTATHAGSTFDLTLSFELTGFELGSQQADMSQIVTVKNKTSQPLDLHFYEYVNLDLLDNGTDSTVLMTKSSAQQTDGLFAISENTALPFASKYQAGIASVVLSNLKTTGQLTNDDGSSATNENLAWAFQWDKTVQSGGTIRLTPAKHLDVVPEPGTFILFGMGGLMGLGLMFCRKFGK